MKNGALIRKVICELSSFLTQIKILFHFFPFSFVPREGLEQRQKLEIKRKQPNA